MFRLPLATAGLILAERRSVRPVARFIWSSMLYPRQMRRLLRFLADETHPALPPAVRVEMVLKLGRDYVRLGLGADERVSLLIGHYASLRRAMRPDCLVAFLADTPVHLAELEGRDGSDSFELLLSRTPMAYRLEGEATLSLRSRNGGYKLIDVTFAIGGSSLAASCIRIGSMQGRRAADGKAAVKAATKALDGLRPKALAIEAVYRIAEHVGADTVLATSLSHHVMRRTPKAHMLRAGPYDEFWEELGGFRRPDGDYELPARLPHRAAAEVPARRRKNWERRQRRIADLEASIRLIMAPSQPVPVPTGERLLADSVT